MDEGRKKCPRCGCLTSYRLYRNWLVERDMRKKAWVCAHCLIDLMRDDGMHIEVKDVEEDDK